VIAVRLMPFVLAAPVLAQPSFTPIGDLPGGSFFSEALCISRDGRVAAGDSVTRNFDPINSIASACRYSAATGLEWLDPTYDTISTFAYTTNQDGSVVAGMAVIVPIFADVEAFRWTPATGIQIIGDLPGGLTNAVARGISADGAIVVGYGSSAASFASCSNCAEAFRWMAQGGLVGLGDLPGGTFDSRAHAISGDGRVIVGHGTNDFGPVAARWDAVGIHSLGYLPQGPSTPRQSQCYGTNLDGSAIVGASSSVNGIYEAFLWTAAGGMRPLGDLATGPFQSYAYAVSDDASVVAGVGTVEGGIFNAGEGRAFIWDAQHGMSDLKAVLTGLGVDLTGWTLSAARGVSADGRVIAGYGINPAGRGEGFIADLGAPACYPNCDASTSLPVLNVDDFVCFQARFAAADPYADCNSDTTLNVLDFVCFQQRFAAGCR
jgi:uncharacterized membrane protein